MGSIKKARGWEYKHSDVLYLTGTKSTGLPMADVIKKNMPPWGAVRGTVLNYLGTHFNPEYNIIIEARYKHFFNLAAITLSENDLYRIGEKAPVIKYLDDSLFEL